MILPLEVGDVLVVVVGTDADNLRQNFITIVYKKRSTTQSLNYGR